jgi:hypothetical protein
VDHLAPAIGKINSTSGTADTLALPLARVQMCW